LTGSLISEDYTGPTSNVDDREKDTRTPLKFYCPWCGNQVVANYIQIGETLNCPYCRIDITVPEYAERTSEDPNVSDVCGKDQRRPQRFG
jgi:DNA-directed RNA polymerase subunit RPC12/RpoP